MTAEYLAAIERALLEGMGRGLMLSAMDLYHARQWFRAGAPAEVVVAGIEKAFASKPRTTRGLAYAAPAVESAIKGWLERRVGGSLDEPVATAVADGEVIAALDDLMKRLADAGLKHVPPVRFVLRDTWKRLNSLKDRCTAGIEADPVGALELLDVETFEALWAVTATEIQAEIDAAVEASLRHETSSSAMAAEARFRRRWKALRLRLALPALVLEMGGGW